MNLRALIVAIGTLSIGGVTYLAALSGQAERPDFVDAGCRVAQVECRLKLETDAGAVYVAGRTGVDVCGDAIVFSLPKRADKVAAQLIGTADEACAFVQPIGTCSVASICNLKPDGTRDVLPQTPACACRRASGTCSWDPDGAGPEASRPAPFGATLAAGTWSGAGCRRKYCGPELAGDQGGSWPAECPDQ